MAALLAASTSTSLSLPSNGFRSAHHRRLQKRPRTACRSFVAATAAGITYHSFLFPGGAAYPFAPIARPPKKPYFRSESSCLVYTPPPGRRPLAVVKFFGGAFVGAVPEVTYSYLLELIAMEGFVVVSVPYGVTFDHESAAREVFERFHQCFHALCSSGIPEAGLEPSVISNLPLYSVGHSNGALLQLLVGSYFSEKLPKANAIVSFNNKPASEAVPYFEQIGPLFSQLVPTMESIPLYSFARSTSGDTWQSMLKITTNLIDQFDKESAISLSTFADQIPSVLNQVIEGTSEFKPTPNENREFFKMAYNVPNTLLIKFGTDAIDETDIVEEILRPRVDLIGGTLMKIVISGNHLTPCVQDLKWQAFPVYTPVDAVAQALKSLALSETRELSRSIVDWFRSLDAE